MRETRVAQRSAAIPWLLDVAPRCRVLRPLWSQFGHTGPAATPSGDPDLAIFGNEVGGK